MNSSPTRLAEEALHRWGYHEIEEELRGKYAPYRGVFASNRGLDEADY